MDGISHTIQLSAEGFALLKRQAEAYGLTVDAWVQVLAQEKANSNEVQPNRQRTLAAAARILEIQKRVRPDPDGWTIRNYIDHGRT